MKFFDRTEEITSLRRIENLAQENARFTVVTGRRRVGKTSLVLEAYKNSTLLYFFVSRKSEHQLCEEFRKETEVKLGVKLGGTPSGFAELFEYLMAQSTSRSFTLFIDEFQNFNRVNPSVFSDMQKIWDLMHTQSKINLVVCGSVFTMMVKLFRDKGEPLYNRQSNFMVVKAFKPSVLKEIMEYYHPNYSKDDLLALYSFTGGIAKYVQILVDDHALDIDSMIDSIVKEDSIFVNEGRTLLIEEFGKDYDTYFSILEAISNGHTRRGEIQTSVGKSVGGYLTRLEDDYNLVTKRIPFGSKPLTKNILYSLDDNFLIFWFRFIFKYENIVEIGGFHHLRRLIKRDYTVFSGKMLERYFIAKAIEEGKYTMVGQWWDSKGHNEIDMICANQFDKEINFYEIKRNRKNASFISLEDKAQTMLSSNPLFKTYKESCHILDLSDM